MAFDFLSSISESKLISNKKTLVDYSSEELAVLAYINILSLRILLSEKESDVCIFAQQYCRKTSQYNNFKKWVTDGTDLYVVLYGLISDEARDEKEKQKSHNSYTHMPIDNSLIINWLKSCGEKKNVVDVSSKLFVKLDTMFRIGDSSLRSIRRLVMDWETITTEQRKLALTRLLQFMRSRAAKGEILPKLNKVAVMRDLELDNVANPETGELKENLILTLETASAGATGAASIAAVVGGLGAGFDADYSRSVYPPPKKKKPTVLRRVTEEEVSPAETMWDEFDSKVKKIAPNCKISLREEGPSQLYISHIAVNWEFRGKGEASRAMSLLCDLADKHKVTLSLSVAEDAEEDFDAESLFDWYERLGFEQTRNRDMVRKPE